MDITGVGAIPAPLVPIRKEFPSAIRTGSLIESILLPTNFFRMEFPPFPPAVLITELFLPSRRRLLQFLTAVPALFLLPVFLIRFWFFCMNSRGISIQAIPSAKTPYCVTGDACFRRNIPVSNPFHPQFLYFVFLFICHSPLLSTALRYKKRLPKKPHCSLCFIKPSVSTYNRRYTAVSCCERCRFLLTPLSRKSYAYAPPHWRSPCWSAPYSRKSHPP